MPELSYTSFQPISARGFSDLTITDRTSVRKAAEQLELRGEYDAFIQLMRGVISKGDLRLGVEERLLDRFIAGLMEHGLISRMHETLKLSQPVPHWLSAFYTGYAGNRIGMAVDALGLSEPRSAAESFQAPKERKSHLIVADSRKPFAATWMQNRKRFEVLARQYSV